AEDYRRLIDEAGPELALACEGLYKILVVLAGSQVRDCRGWILDDRQQPRDAENLAKLLFLSKDKVTQILEILTSSAVKWVEYLDLPESICKSLNSSELEQDPQVGNNKENLGSPLYETETEPKHKENRFRNETETERVREKSGMGDGVEEENPHPQPQPGPPAQV
ncbi:unnamed protein product, partial [marine sediment metagenome]